MVGYAAGVTDANIEIALSSRLMESLRGSSLLAPGSMVRKAARSIAYLGRCPHSFTCETASSKMS